MFNHEQFFPAPLDTDAQKVAKLTRLTSAQLGVNGKVSISDTAAHTPALGQDAFAIVEATSATVIATLESVNPDGSFSSASTVSLAAGQRMHGYFTLVQLTSGAVNVYPIPSNENSPAVPSVAGSFDVVAGVTLNISKATGWDTFGKVTVQRKVGAGAYANLGSPASEVGGAATVVDASPTPGQTIKYRAFYNETYNSGVSRGRAGALSNEYIVGTPSNDATLSALVLTGAGASLTPSFASGTTSYTSPITDGTASVTVTPTVNEAHATIQVKIGAGSFATVASGSPSGALALVVGVNTITVLVTAQDGITTDTYTIAVTRSA
jgi:cadherin-like protein